MVKTCNVCCENITEYSKTECPFCEFTCCKTCIQKYSLETTEDLHCMSCHRYFDRFTQETMFTKTFLNKTYKKRL